MSRSVYVSGEFVPQERAVVSVFDHGYLYGDGIFEGLRAYNGRVFELEAHMRRLYESARAIMLDIPHTMEELSELVLEACRQNDLCDAYIRLVVSRGRGDLGLDPAKCPDPAVVIIADALQLYPPELYEQGLSVGTAATRRNGPEAVNPRVKSLNYLNNILAKIEARLAGYAEVIMLNDAGYVVECTGDNIFIIKDDRVITPPTYVGILEGVTRSVVMDLARSRGLEVSEQVFTRHDVFVADECFLTGTAAEVIPVIKVDGRIVGSGKPGPITRRLIDDYRGYATSTGTPIYDTWAEQAVGGSS